MNKAKSFIAALAVACVSLPTIAFAHSELIKSEPAADGTLAPFAKEVVFTFSESIKPASCKLTAQDGTEVPSLGKPHAEGAVLHIPLTKMPGEGHYKLGCRVVGPDSHPVNESISFGVSATSAK